MLGTASFIIEEMLNEIKERKIDLYDICFLIDLFEYVEPKKSGEVFKFEANEFCKVITPSSMENEGKEEENVSYACEFIQKSINRLFEITIRVNYGEQGKGILRISPLTGYLRPTRRNEAECDPRLAISYNAAGELCISPYISKEDLELVKDRIIHKQT